MSNELIVSWKTKVSERILNSCMYVIKSGKSIQHINQSINKKITHVEPHQNPIYFCMNQFCKFHHLELQN